MGSEKITEDTTTTAPDLLESISAKPEETQPRKGIPAIIDWQKKSIQVCKNDK